jgi:hypothetical protein
MSFRPITSYLETCTNQRNCFLVPDYEKIDIYQDNFMLFWKEHINEKKCLKCGKSRFIEVINADGEEVMTEIAYKQLRYMPLTLRLS